MNADTIIGQDKNLTGQIKEAAGKTLGDEQLQGSGMEDQVSGRLQKLFDNLRDFVRERPFTAAALGAFFVLATANTLRDK